MGKVVKVYNLHHFSHFLAGEVCVTLIYMKVNKDELFHAHVNEYPKLVKQGIFVIDGEVWSTQKRLSKIYGKSIPTINDHLKNIYKEKELLQAETEMQILVTQKEGKREIARVTFVYNTDALIAIGFRVKGEWGKGFRVWAREIVRESYDPKEHMRRLV